MCFEDARAVRGSSRPGDTRLNSGVKSGHRMRRPPARQTLIAGQQGGDQPPPLGRERVTAAPPACWSVGSRAALLLPFEFLATLENTCQHLLTSRPRVRRSCSALPSGDTSVRRGDAFLAAKSGYAGAMRRVRGGLTRAGVLSEQPPERDRRLAHWVYSLTRIHDSAGLVAMDVPWWTYRAIDAVDAWLAARSQPARVFEYGSGASTVWLARRAAEVHSVEHHAGFAAQFKSVLDDHDNVELSLVEPRPSSNPIAPSGKEGYQGVDFGAYVGQIDHVGGLFDLVVVDGRARVACLAAALPHLKSDGLVVFDNSGRSRYRGGIAAAPLRERRLCGLVPTLPYPDCTSLLTRA